MFSEMNLIQTSLENKRNAVWWTTTRQQNDTISLLLSQHTVKILYTRWIFSDEQNA